MADEAATTLGSRATRHLETVVSLSGRYERAVNELCENCWVTGSPAANRVVDRPMGSLDPGRAAGHLPFMSDR